VDDGTAILEEVMACLRVGRHPFADAVTAAFESVDVVPTPGLGPAQVTCATSDQLIFCEAPLPDVLLPVMARKQARHGARAASLTLVAQIFDRGWTAADIVAVQQAFGPEQRGFFSAYVFRCPAQDPARIDRLY
jgi:hypothetical protein